MQMAANGPCHGLPTTVPINYVFISYLADDAGAKAAPNPAGRECLRSRTTRGKRFRFSAYAPFASQLCRILIVSFVLAGSLKQRENKDVFLQEIFWCAAIKLIIRIIRF